ncbi:MAG: tnpA [Ferruginibacter sp.]|nr:tnpA [Ferruginibacter sp.]
MQKYEQPLGLPTYNIAMSSYRQIFYQIVFGTKYRRPTINLQHDEKLYQYISGIVKNGNCQLFWINGVEDHIHIATELHPSISLADFVKDIKVASSLWMKASGYFPDFIGWQIGYAAFTYSIRERNMIIQYVKNQKLHHKVEGFYAEYIRMLQENKVAYNEKYLLSE